MYAQYALKRERKIVNAKMRQQCGICGCIRASVYYTVAIYTNIWGDPSASVPPPRSMWGDVPLKCLMFGGHLRLGPPTSNFFGGTVPSVPPKSPPLDWCKKVPFVCLNYVRPFLQARASEICSSVSERYFFLALAW